MNMHRVTCCDLQGHDCNQGRACPARRVRATPFNTGKVQIGIAHTPKPAPLTADQERMQAALLDQRTARPQPMLQRLFGAIWSWL
jgi:hypothetical protein